MVKPPNPHFISFEAILEKPSSTQSMPSALAAPTVKDRFVPNSILNISHPMSPFIIGRIVGEKSKTTMSNVIARIYFVSSSLSIL